MLSYAQKEAKAVSKYTTGEIAKLCSVSVRTVQYYDKRGLLVPSELSEGGRRLYSEDDLKRMKVICFLRELGISIDCVSQILNEENSSNVISALLEQQEIELRSEIAQNRERLKKIEDLRNELTISDDFSLNAIGDIAHTMKGKKELRRIRRNMLLSAIPVCILQWTSIVLWIVLGFWWLFVIWAVIGIPYAVFITKYYYKHTSYICPQCHTVFKPKFRDFLFSSHTFTTRKLTCTSCGHRGFCIETVDEELSIDTAER